MRLAFLGSHHAFNYYNIGGTDSLIRRLALGLIKANLTDVDMLTYGHVVKHKEQTHSLGLRSCYYSRFEDVLAVLPNYDQVVTIYLPIRDRLKFAVFRQQMRDKIQIHMLFQSWPDSVIKRQLMFLDARLVPFNGIVFGVSPRLVKCIGQWNKKATLLWPSVPTDYFVPLAVKKKPNQTRVTFLGRIDPGKGVNETIELFNVLSNKPNIQLSFYGMHWPHDPEAVRLHQELSSQDCFPYTNVEFTGYSANVDEMVRRVLRETDVFVQPYRKLSSTIDTPLLILEAMAALSTVLTKPYGNIPLIYGQSTSLIPDDDFLKRATDLILSADAHWLDAERRRINDQNSRLGFDTPSVVKVFADALNLN